MWIIVEDGEVFEGNEKHWGDCFFSNVNEEAIRNFCESHGWKVTISDTEPELDKQLAKLAEMTDDQIDTSDIPEVTDWSGAEVGKFYRGNK